MLSIRIICFSVTGRLNDLFLQDMKKAFEMQLRKLLTETPQLQCQLSDLDAINQLKKQDIETLEANCSFIITGHNTACIICDHTVCLCGKSTLLQKDMVYTLLEVAKSTDMHWKRYFISLRSRKFYLG